MYGFILFLRKYLKAMEAKEVIFLSVLVSFLYNFFDHRVIHGRGGRKWGGDKAQGKEKVEFGEGAILVKDFN
jgi:hypothetical protein